MSIEKNISLVAYNTFGINVIASNLFRLNNISQTSILVDLKNQHEKHMILGGGSNVLFTEDYSGLIIRNELKGIDVVKENEDYVWIKAMAGEIWHELVMYCVNHNYGGIENLSLIPGFVGAAPMQNIGAYGVELKNVFFVLEAFNINGKEFRLFDSDDCRFGYRDSIFKNELKDQYIILSVTLKLKKNGEVNTSYGAIQKILRNSNISDPSIKDVSQAVIAIRQSKLPDPSNLGNSGSFFKNPILRMDQFNQLKKEHPEIPSYSIDMKSIKVPAGWLIEQCGWKGKQIGNTGTYKNQSLVIVNYGNASGKEILDLSKDIQTSVMNKFNIKLSPEVNIIS